MKKIQVTQIDNFDVVTGDFRIVRKNERIDIHYKGKLQVKGASNVKGVPFLWRNKIAEIVLIFEKDHILFFEYGESHIPEYILKMEKIL